MPTVPSLPSVTLPLAGTETLWLTQGSGAGRDKKITVADVQDYVLDPITWESQDISAMNTTSAIYTGLGAVALTTAAPSSDVKLATVQGTVLMDATIVWQDYSANALNAYQAGFTIPLAYDGVPDPDFKKLIPCALRKLDTSKVHISTVPCYVCLEHGTSDTIMFYNADGTPMLWSDLLGGVGTVYSIVHISSAFIGAVVG